MPKYTALTAERKAESLAKPFLRNNCNIAKTARELGVTPQAINQRLSHKPVQDTLQKYINSPELRKKLIAVAEGALKAQTYTKRGVKPDHDARHKFWHDLITASGILKSPDGGVKVINIIHAYRKEKNAGSS